MKNSSVGRKCKIKLTIDNTILTPSFTFRKIYYKLQQVKQVKYNEGTRNGKSWLRHYATTN